VTLKDIGAEGVLLAGGGRAVLLQLANPAIGHAVADHSGFAGNPVRRLRNTLTFVYALVYGTPEQVKLVTAMVNRAHVPVRSDEYDASDARLQLWVAATLYETAVSLHGRVFGPLADPAADAVYQEYAVVGTALGMPLALWPPDRAAFRSYWNGEVARLSVDDRVRAVCGQLLHPKTGPLWMHAAMPLARIMTAGLLSPELRTAYGLAWSERRERRFRRILRATALVYPRLPMALREWPKRYLLRALG
jgi:uncharacterized protein (DUF2236 family)